MLYILEVSKGLMKQKPNKVRQFRLRNKLTQQQLANILSVHITTVQRWEAGKINKDHIVFRVLEKTNI
jgi:DNA-binding transcriptional regulator YiaG